MSDTEMVIRTFGHARKTGQTVQKAQGVEAAGPAREQLVGIGLVPHVPNQLVLIQVKGGKQGQSPVS